MSALEGHDEFLSLIPQTILIQHYVSLRLLLKQLVVHVFPAELSACYCCSEIVHGGNLTGSHTLLFLLLKIVSGSSKGFAQTGRSRRTLA